MLASKKLREIILLEIQYHHLFIFRLTFQCFGSLCWLILRRIETSSVVKLKQNDIVDSNILLPHQTMFASDTKLERSKASGNRHLDSYFVRLSTLIGMSWLQYIFCSSNACFCSSDMLISLEIRWNTVHVHVRLFSDASGLQIIRTSIAVMPVLQRNTTRAKWADVNKN